MWAIGFQEIVETLVRRRLSRVFALQMLTAVRPAWDRAANDKQQHAANDHATLGGIRCWLRERTSSSALYCACD